MGGVASWVRFQTWPTAVPSKQLEGIFAEDDQRKVPTLPKQMLSAIKPQLLKEVEQKKLARADINIAFVGRVRSGKSSVINNIARWWSENVRSKLAVTRPTPAEGNSCTMETKRYDLIETYGNGLPNDEARIVLWDTSGFEDSATAVDIKAMLQPILRPTETDVNKLIHHVVIVVSLADLLEPASRAHVTLIIKEVQALAVLKGFPELKYQVLVTKMDTDPTVEFGGSEYLKSQYADEKHRRPFPWDRIGIPLCKDYLPLVEEHLIHLVGWLDFPVTCSGAPNKRTLAPQIMITANLMLTAVTNASDTYWEMHRRKSSGTKVKSSLDAELAAFAAGLRGDPRSEA